jgi:hypothetical protein
MVVVTSVIAAVVTSIITSIPVVIAAVWSTVTVVVMVVAVLVVVVIALGFLGFRGYSKGTLQLFALPHVMFGVAVELTLVVHDHVEVTLVEGGRLVGYHIAFTGSLARPISVVVVILSVEFVHHRVLSVN